MRKMSVFRVVRKRAPRDWDLFIIISSTSSALRSYTLTSYHKKIYKIQFSDAHHKICILMFHDPLEPFYCLGKTMKKYSKLISHKKGYIHFRCQTPLPFRRHLATRNNFLLFSWKIPFF